MSSKRSGIIVIFLAYHKEADKPVFEPAGPIYACQRSNRPDADFGSDPVIADVFGRLNAAGAFSGGCAAALRPEPVAVEHLAKSIRDTWMLAGGSIDRNGDGVFDGARQIVRNASGRVMEQTDFGADWVLYREYDDANNTETIRRDDGRSFSFRNNRPLHCWLAAAQPERRLGRRRPTNHPEQFVEDSGSV